MANPASLFSSDSKSAMRKSVSDKFQELMTSELTKVPAADEKQSSQLDITKSKTMEQEKLTLNEALESVRLQEFGRTMVLKSVSTGESVANYSRVDWQANKRVYRNRVFYSNTAYGNLEYHMTFMLPQTTLIREI